MRTQLSTLGYSSGELRLPVYAGMPKVHKLATGLLKWRFLSYSSDIFSTPLAKALTLVAESAASASGGPLGQHGLPRCIS